jgi:hypothetical protein
MLTNEIWLRKTIVFTNRVLLIHRKRSPFPAGEGIDDPNLSTGARGTPSVWVAKKGAKTAIFLLKLAFGMPLICLE